MLNRKRLVFWTVLLLGLVLLLTVAGCNSNSEEGKGEHAGRTLTLQVWPGSYEEVFTEYVFKPFEEKYGVEIISTTAVEWYNMAKVKTEVDSGDPQIDMVTLVPGDVVIGERMGLWEELDKDKLTFYDDLYDGAKVFPDAIGYLLYCYGFGYRIGDDVVDPPST